VDVDVIFKALLFCASAQEVVELAAQIDLGAERVANRRAETEAVRIGRIAFVVAHVQAVRDATGHLDCVLGEGLGVSQRGEHESTNGQRAAYEVSGSHESSLMVDRGQL